MSALPLPGSTKLRVRSVSRSHVGCVRTINEDRVLDRPRAALWAVADGMGGHAGGAEAASRTIDALAGIDHGTSGAAFLVDIAAALRSVSRTLHGDSGPTRGSTIVALLIHEGHYACVWAGDSRAYLLRDGALGAITRDHSIVQQMVDRGMLSEGERRAHPKGHVITRALGVAPRLQLDQYSAPVRRGDVFLLCSDGLIACMDEVEIAAYLVGHDLDAAAELLLATALARGAPDNVSFVLLTLS